MPGWNPVFCMLKSKLKRKLKLKNIKAKQTNKQKIKQYWCPSPGFQFRRSEWRWCICNTYVDIPRVNNLRRVLLCFFFASMFLEECLWGQGPTPSLCRPSLRCCLGSLHKPSGAFSQSLNGNHIWGHWIIDRVGCTGCMSTCCGILAIQVDLKLRRMVGGGDQGPNVLD